MKISSSEKTEHGRFDSAVKKLLSVSHKELQRRLKHEENAKARIKKGKSAKSFVACRALDVDI